jgi:H/ACA ribonucleoprotein complex subunit 2
MAAEGDLAAAAAASAKELKRKDKKDKKEKKAPRSESDGVHKDKKDRKKERHAAGKLASALDAHLQAEVAAGAAEEETKRRRKEEKKARKDKAAAGGADDAGDDAEMKGADDPAEGKTSLEGALVYFAHPMADEKAHKKLFKLIKKGPSPCSLC